MYTRLTERASDDVCGACRYSGITEKMLRGVSTTFEEIREMVKRFVKADTILVGHGLENDLWVLKVSLVHRLIALFPLPIVCSLF
jgi:DNA polymerase III epsilon subunit-like protein